MRAVIQRVKEAEVTVEQQVAGRIEQGIVALVGFAETDRPDDLGWMARKIAGLRIFNDSEGKMNLSVGQVKGRILVVPNFTLYGDVSRGRRPSFAAAAQPDAAEQLFDRFVAALGEQGVEIAQGEFGASMQVSIVNDGPVTLIIDTELDR
ncbi:MAG: D-tyrosyl-tRNA(Tyr) deacylase [Armatimonadetes bacterium]|nr:D-tyrosyl-tRNA(Tyr) deacylase [Armatimonadota bacterium]